MINEMISAVQKCRFSLKDYCAIARLHKTHRRGRNNQHSITVCFVSQMIEVWDKQAPIFEAMIADSRFYQLFYVCQNLNSLKRLYLVKNVVI